LTVSITFGKVFFIKPRNFSAISFFSGSRLLIISSTLVPLILIAPSYQKYSCGLNKQHFPEPKISQGFLGTICDWSLELLR